MPTTWKPTRRDFVKPLKRVPPGSTDGLPFFQAASFTRLCCGFRSIDGPLGGREGETPGSRQQSAGVQFITRPSTWVLKKLSKRSVNSPLLFG